jgi:hypothetical protein
MNFLSDDEFVQLTLSEQDEYLRLLEADLSAWRLTGNKRQEQAHALVKKTDWLLYGGAAGGGKSELLAYHAHELSMQYPGHRTLLVRTALPELRRSLIIRSQVRYAQLNVEAQLRSIDNVKAWWYGNGSIIEYGFCSRDEDVGQYMSAEYDFIGFDEATQFTPYQMLMISGRLRTSRKMVKLGVRTHVMFATNPGDRGHTFLYKMMVQPTAHGRYAVVYDVREGFENPDIVRRVEIPDDPAEIAAMDIPHDPEDHLVLAFVPSTVDDNPHIDPTYRKHLSMLPETERKQKLLGDWDTFTGQYFTEFKRDIHVVTPFEIPPEWPRYRGIDFGTANPYCCLWGAWDPATGICYVYRETYEKNLTAAQQAQQVKAMSLTSAGKPENIVATAIDPSTYNNTSGMGQTVSGVYNQLGVAVVRAKNARISGWQNVRRYLQPNQDTGEPKLKIFSTCEHLLRTLPAMRHDKTKVEDIDTDDEDHAVDALRYLLATRPYVEINRKSKQFRQGAEGRVQKFMDKLDKSAKKRRW